MKSFRYRPSLTAIALAATVGSAHATINMTGRWSTGTDVLEFTQAGTNLTQTPPTAGQPGPRTGTIDSTTGTFTLSDPVQCTTFGLLESCSISGTVAPDGLTFTGAISCAGGLGCFVPPPEPFMGWRSPATCGDGIVDPGEQCDNGTNLPGTCCDPGCRFEASGTLCGPSNCLETHACDGSGTCIAGAPEPCDQCSRCDPDSANCLPAPATSCRAPAVPGSARLTLKTTVPSVSAVTQSSLKWKWAKGQATTLDDFGDPLHVDGYTFCLYVGSPPSSLLHIAIPTGSGWRESGHEGFAYRDRSGAAQGVTNVNLRAGADGKAKILVRAAKGPNLMLPPDMQFFQLAMPITVQLRGHDECWAAGYVQGGVKKSTATVFVAASYPSGAFLDDGAPGTRR